MAGWEHSAANRPGPRTTLESILARIPHHVWMLSGGCGKGGASAPPFQTRGENCVLGGGKKPGKHAGFRWTTSPHMEKKEKMDF
jgi:hypothetical protein